MHLHVYLHCTRDAKSRAALIEDLANRMAAALEDLMGWSKTQDEDKGHEFHGNQWTGGLGAKPTTVKAKSAKAGIHELLSSGHPFSKEELMSVCGVKTEKLFSDYIAMLKNPKYAGPAGALAIAKDGAGMFHVVLKGTAPKEAADPLPQLMELLGVADPTVAPKKTTLAPAPDPTDQFELGDDSEVSDEAAAVVAAQSVKGTPYEQALKALTGVHPGSMTKSEADKHYQSALVHAYGSLVASATAGADAKTAALLFKNRKAESMAAWATAVHGHAFAPKPQQVFKADVALVHSLFDDALAKVHMDKHLAQWKTNTSLEKQGNFPPKETPDKPAASKAPLGNAAPVAPRDYHKLVPASFTPITVDDFKAIGKTEMSKYSKGLNGLKKTLMQSGADSAVGNKKSVESRLRARLKDKPNFAALTERAGLMKEGSSSLEARLVSTWADSSGDNDPLSVAVQLAVRDAFGVPDGHVEKKALHALQNHAHEDALYKSAMSHINGNVTISDAEVPVVRGALQEFVQAMYDETQDHLKGLGIKELYLARGMKNVHLEAGENVALKLQPASSFSTSYSTAKAFAGGSTGAVFLTKVPREQVLGSFVTGFGCTSENEVVVIAHEKTRAFTAAPNAAAGGGLAAQHVYKAHANKKPS